MDRQIRQLIDANPDALIVTDGQGLVRHANGAAARLLAGAGEDLVGTVLGFSCGEGVTEIELLGHPVPRTAELRVADIEWQGEPATLATIRDVTENRQIARQLREAQKTEAVGLLAGGIAHDFNNLLVVIMGNIEFLKEDCPPNDPHARMIRRIEIAAERAHHLTRQLLVLSRRQPSRPVAADPNELVARLYDMLRRSLPSAIELVVRPGEANWTVRVDPGEFDQLLINLTFNARHALPDGGRIEVDVANHALSSTAGSLPPGDYVRIRVIDNGSGIAPGDLPRIFEPFFTTKSAGTGTGLGLAICQGIVRRAGGDVLVESLPGVGSTFTVLIPRSFDEPVHVEPPEPAPRESGHERVLVVEDDTAVAASVTDALRSRGFQTLSAANGEQAVRLIAGTRERIDLVLSDVVMPQMGGLELSQWLTVNRPGMKMLLTTGYADTIATLKDAGDPLRGIVFKPFTPSDLVRNVRAILDR